MKLPQAFLQWHAAFWQGTQQIQTICLWILSGYLADILSADVAYGDDNRPRGFGHLDFAESAAGAKATAKSGQDFMGREIFVDLAANKPRTDNRQDRQQQPS